MTDYEREQAETKARTIRMQKKKDADKKAAKLKALEETKQKQAKEAGAERAEKLMEDGFEEVQRSEDKEDDDDEDEDLNMLLHHKSLPVQKHSAEKEQEEDRFFSGG